MKQIYKALFRVSILLILGGLFTRFTLINLTKNTQKQSDILLIKELKKYSKTLLNKTDYLTLSLSSKKSIFFTKQLSLNFQNYGNSTFFFKFVFINFINYQKMQFNQQILIKKYQVKNLLLNQDNSENQLIHNNYCKSIFCLELFLEDLNHRNTEIFLLFLSLTTGSAAVILYAVYTLKQNYFKNYHCSSSNYLNDELKKYLNNDSKIKQLIAENKILLNSSGKILFVAENLLNKLGYTPQELLGESVDILLGLSNFIFDDNDLNAKYNQVFNQKQKVLNCKTGEKIISLLSWVVLKKKNQIQGAILVVTDITEHHNLKQAWQNEKKFRQLTEKVPIATFIYQEQKFVYVNSAMAMITGYSKEALLKMNFWQVIHPDCHKMLKQGLRQNKNIQQPIHWQGEIKMLTKTGEERWVDFTVSLIKLDQKIGLLGTAFDLSDRKQMEQSIKGSEQRYRHLIELSPAVIFVHKKGKLVFVNPAALKLLGAGNSKLVLGKPMQKFWVEDYKKLIQVQFKQASKNEGILAPIEHHLIRLDGHVINMASTFTPVIYEEEPAIMSTGIDITQHKEAEQALKESEARYKQILGSVTDYIYTVRVKNGKAIATSHGHGCIAVTGYTPEEFAADSYLWYDIVYPDDLEAVKNQTAEILSQGNAEAIEHRIIKKNGDLLWVRNTPVVRKDTQGVIISYDALISDITERKQAQEKVNYQAFHDLLTGLPNRALYNKRLYEALTKVQRQGHHLAVMFLDLDLLKTINDPLGHGIGNLLLQQVAQRVSGCLRRNDTLSRWGGDQFTLLLPYIQYPEDAVRVAQRIITSLKPVFDLNGHQIQITTSIGIAVYPQDGEDVETLLGNAEVALYRAKEQQSTYRVYATTMNSQASELLALQNNLHPALERGEFQVHYQPQVNVKAQKIVGMEALVRWQHPEHGLLPPIRFLPLAEETGLIVEIGQWVLHTACEQNKSWLQAGLPPIQMGVNLSARQFQEPNVVEMVSNILNSTGLPANLLELEITETIAMQNVEWTTEVLGQLQSLGVNLSMDDFGTGYSSLSYLHKFPFNALKVDQSFVEDINVDRQDREIAQAVIALGRSLGMRTIAEGVETVEQLEVLRAMQCEDMQGYLFSPPIPALEATKLLIEYNRDQRQYTA